MGKKILDFYQIILPSPAIPPLQPSPWISLSLQQLFPSNMADVSGEASQIW